MTGTIHNCAILVLVKHYKDLPNYKIFIIIMIISNESTFFVNDVMPHSENFCLLQNAGYINIGFASYWAEINLLIPTARCLDLNYFTTAGNIYTYIPTTHNHGRHQSEIMKIVSRLWEVIHKGHPRFSSTIGTHIHSILSLKTKKKCMYLIFT